MNPFAQLIAPTVATSRRLPVTGPVLKVVEGVRLAPPGRGIRRVLPQNLQDVLARLKADGLDDEERADLEALAQQLRRERQLQWYRERYARKKQDPAFLERKRARERAARPKRRAYQAKWEARNADHVRAYKTQWAQLQRANETPEERAARRAVQREKERAYYAANRELILAKAKAKRDQKRMAKAGAAAA